MNRAVSLHNFNKGNCFQCDSIWHFHANPLLIHLRFSIVANDFPFSSPLRMNCRHQSLHAHRSLAYWIYDKSKRKKPCAFDCVCVCLLERDLFPHRIKTLADMTKWDQTIVMTYIWVVWFRCSSYCSMPFFRTRYCIAGMFSNTLYCTNRNGSSIVNSLFELRNWHASRTQRYRGQGSEKETERWRVNLNQRQLKWRCTGVRISINNSNHRKTE